MRRWSISLRLTAWFGAIFFLGWLLFGATMWLNLKTTLAGERHQTLSWRAGRLEDLLKKTQGESAADQSQDFADFASATGNGLCEVFRQDGQRAYPSPAPAAQAFPWPPVRSIRSDRFEQVHWSGQDYWVLMHPFDLGGEPLLLYAAAPEAGNELVLQRFLAGLLASVPVLLLVSSAVGYFLSRKALRPVDRITASARSISITNLSERVPVAATGDELQRLAETCNAMLERLETAVNRIRQFTADASHDLRGPISFMRTVAEVALRNPAADAAALLLEDLLTLARADSAQLEVVLAPLDLAEVVEEACELARPLALERRHTLSVSEEAWPRAKILGDGSSLRRLLWILLDNAVKYTPSPGRIDVTLTAANQRATVTVRDNGIGISEADLPRIFDRFFRADPSRSQVEGSGLGLSIARWIAETHHADLSVDSTENTGTAFRVEFPLFAG